MTPMCYRLGLLLGWSYTFRAGTLMTFASSLALSPGCSSIADRLSLIHISEPTRPY